MSARRRQRRALAAAMSGDRRGVVVVLNARLDSPAWRVPRGYWTKRLRVLPGSRVRMIVKRPVADT